MQLVVSTLRDVRNIIPYTQFAEKILYTRVRDKRISSNSPKEAYSPMTYPKLVYENQIPSWDCAKYSLKIKSQVGIVQNTR